MYFTLRNRAAGTPSGMCDPLLLRLFVSVLFTTDSRPVDPTDFVS